MKKEWAGNTETSQEDQDRALHHLAVAERNACAPNGLPDGAVSLCHVAVAGGGTRGAGIAYALLRAGLRVSLFEVDAEGVERARDNVEKIMLADLARGMISKSDVTDCRVRLSVGLDYAQAADATLAIEAASESMTVKRTVFAALEKYLPKDAIFASSTSSFDINDIAEKLSDPTRVVGLHFCAPAQFTKLLEIAQGDLISDRALATAFALARHLRKVPVASGVCDGFIANRILARYHEAADTVLLEGSTPWEVDEAMVEFGYAMGPYEVQDLTGLDNAHTIRRRQDASRDPNRRNVKIMDRMIELGKLGKKVGAGWYRYPGGGGKVDDPIVADLAIEEAYFDKVTRREFSPGEIRIRLLLAMINEAADILNEGIAASADDIDLVTVLGHGFPKWRGGLMYFADTIGVPVILRRLQALAEEDPIVWAPSPALVTCENSGIPLSEFSAR